MTPFCFFCKTENPEPFEAGNGDDFDTYHWFVLNEEENTLVHLNGDPLGEQEMSWKILNNDVEYDGKDKLVCAKCADIHFFDESSEDPDESGEEWKKVNVST